MHLQLIDLLYSLRRRRAFEPNQCLQEKANRINDYFSGWNLDSAVVGLSGGIDSSVTAGLLLHASQQPDSPIRRVVGLIVPICDTGSTEQDVALVHARLVASKLELETWRIDMTESMLSAGIALDRSRRVSPTGWPTLSSWTRGQMLSVMRTPVFYGAAAALQQDGFRSVVVGTTNRDEGAYIGFFGKASDAMVDIQPISDLHKSEVRALAAVLEIPQTIINRTPRGDVWDGKSDEEMIGTSYDFLELYQLLKCLAGDELGLIIDHLCQEARSEFNTCAGAVEDLHSGNLHKYFVGNPSAHLDVYERAVPGGWE